MTDFFSAFPGRDANETTHSSGIKSYFLPDPFLKNDLVRTSIKKAKMKRKKVEWKKISAARPAGNREPELEHVREPEPPLPEPPEPPLLPNSGSISQAKKGESCQY